MTTMRQRVAFAICQHAILDCCWRKTGENAEASKQCASCGSAASAVLKAMHEPTEYMSDVGAQKLFDEMAVPKEPTVIDRVWASMIDTAMKETGT